MGFEILDDDSQSLLPRNIIVGTSVGGYFRPFYYTTLKYIQPFYYTFNLSTFTIFSIFSTATILYSIFCTASIIYSIFCTANILYIQSFYRLIIASTHSTLLLPPTNTHSALLPPPTTPTNRYPTLLLLPLIHIQTFWGNT